MKLNNASELIIADLLAERTGQQLSESRRWRIGTSLAGIFRERGISNVDQLVCLLALEKESQLEQEVVEALLNNETYFFRDKPTFKRLAEDILPLLARRRADKRRLQIWCAGCSTGQEVHSLAIMFNEMAAKWDGWSIDILGTDISHKAISAARSGHYSQFEVQRGLTVSQMLRHFDETTNGWQMHSDSRNFVRFQIHNVLNPPPARNQFDLILCRNVLLYFDSQTRKRAFSRLQEAIAPDGFLMLGAGETIVGQTDRFRPSGSKMSLYEPATAPQNWELARSDAQPSAAR